MGTRVSTRRDIRTFPGRLLEIAFYLVDITLRPFSWGSRNEGEPRSYFERDRPVTILPHLMLGNHHHAGALDSIRKANIQHIISVGYRCVANPFVASPVKTRHEYDVKDEIRAYIFPIFATATAEIHENVRRGENTLVHCHRGRSRSVAVVAAYLIRYRGMTLAAALSFIKRKRPMAQPNKGFLHQLEAWERLWAPARGSSPARPKPRGLPVGGR